MKLPKFLRPKHHNPRIHGASDQAATKAFISNRSFMANQWILLATPLVVLGFAVIGYAAFAAPLSAPAGYIDYPAPGAAIGGSSQQIAGWAVALSPIDHVDIVVNGVHARANYGTGARPDVCAIYPQTPNCAAGANVAWSYPFNSNAMPNGSYSLYAVFYGSAGGVTNSAVQTFTVNNQPPAGFIDTPSQGQTVTGTINVAGWALDSASYAETAISSIAMSIDAYPLIYYPIYNGARPDVCAVYPNRPNCPNVGFNYSLDTTKIPNGWHTLHVTAYDNDIPQRSVTIDRIVNFSNAGPPPVITGPGTTPTGGGGGTTPPTGGPVGNGIDPDGYMDHPVSSSTPRSGYLTFDGWAVDAQTVIQKVSIIVDGTLIGNARYGQGTPRPDVCASHAGWINCQAGNPGYVGWAMTYDTSNLTNGAHKVHAVIYDGEYPQHHHTTADVSFTTSNKIITPPTSPANLPPDVFIDAVNDPGTAKTSASGWALDNVTKAESAIKKVTVSVNGVPKGTAVYGTSRPDVCTKYPGRPGCTATASGVGWTISFDSSTLAAGSTNSLQVTATDGTGQTKTATKSFTVTQAGGGTAGAGCPAGDAFCQGHMPEGDIDEINDLSDIKPDNTSGSILVTGWAIDGKLDRAQRPIDHVEVYVDRVDAAHDMGKAKYGYKNAVNYYRRAVCQTFETGANGDRFNIPCPNIGWSYELNTVSKGIGDGRHILIAKVVDNDQPVRSTILKHTFRVENKSGGGRVNIETRPIGMITNPEDFNDKTNLPVQKGTFKLTGWAMDKDTAISEVNVDITGNGENGFFTIKDKAALGKPTAPGVCAAHKTYVGCGNGNVGWEYAIKTADLPKVHGLYYVSITVVDSDTPAKHISEDPCAHIDNNLTAKQVQAIRNKCKLGRGNKSADIAYSRSFNTGIPFSPSIKNIPLGTMDTPGTNNPTYKGKVNFNGWGLDSSADPITPISHVTYSLDNQPASNPATYGGGNPRLDVCKSYPGRPGCVAGQANYAKVGWQFDVDTTQLDDGQHIVHVNIFDSDPSQHSLTIDRDFIVDNNPGSGTPANLKPDVLIESVTPNGASTSASGWALDNITKAESGIKSVTIAVDGNQLGTAAYGSARPAICDPKTGYPGRKGCPKVGWEFSFDSSTIYNGSHSLEATAIDDTGLSKSAALTYSVTNNPPPPPAQLQTRSTADRPPDPGVGTSPQVHLLYITPSDGRDRQLDINNRLDVMMNVTNAWLSRQTGGQTIRYDTYGNGAHADVTFIRTTRTSAYYQTLGTSILSVVQNDALSAGLRSPNTIYLMYFEGGSVSACGYGYVPGNYSVMNFFGSYTDGGQCQSVDMNPAGRSMEYFDIVAMHEFMHNLGAVEPCAPHYYSPNGGHTSDPIDLLNGLPNGFPALDVVTLDPGNDDYFGLNVPAGCLNVKSSPYFK